MVKIFGNAQLFFTASQHFRDSIDRSCKRQNGQFRRIAATRRIAEARRILLEHPVLTVEAVALQVGFSDFALFNRSFKRLAGQPPTLYRKISHLNRND